MKKKNKEKFQSDREEIFTSLAKSTRHSRENLEENTGSAVYNWLVVIAVVFIAFKAGWLSYIFELILSFVHWYMFGLRDICKIQIAQLTLANIFDVATGLCIRLLIGYIVYAIISGILESFKKESEEY